MHFSTIAALAALAFQSSTASPTRPVAARDDPHIVDFRTFGAFGCYDKNQGVYTLTRSQIGECYTFKDPMFSMDMHNNTCLLTLYRDPECHDSPVVVPESVCQNGHWQSYQLTC